MIVGPLLIAHLVSIGVSVLISVGVGIVQIVNASGVTKTSLTDAFTQEITKLKADITALEAKFEKKPATPATPIDTTIEKKDNVA